MNKRPLGKVNITINGDSLFWFVVSLFAVMVIVRDVWNVDISRWLFISITFAVCTFGSKNHIYLLLAFLAPMASGVSYTYISIVALACLLVRYKLHVSGTGFAAVVFILFWELIQGFRGMFDFVEYLRFAAVFVVTFLHMIDTDHNVDHEQMLKMYLLGFVVAMIDLVGQFLTVYSFGELLKLNLRLGNVHEILEIGEEGIRLSYNPNGLGMVCVLGLLFSLLLLRKAKWPAVYVLLALLSGLIGFMTQSRTYMVVLAFSVAAYILLSGATVKSAVKTLVGSVAFGGLLYCVLLYLMPNYLQSFMSRWSEADLSNGRIDIMGYYMEKMLASMDRFLFGVGMQNYAGKYGFYMSAHNATQEILITWGVVGIVAVAILFGSILRNAKKRNKQAQLIQYLPLFSVLLYKQAGQGFADTASMLGLMVAYSAAGIELIPSGERAARE